MYIYTDINMYIYNHITEPQEIPNYSGSPEVQLSTISGLILMPTVNTQMLQVIMSKIRIITTNNSML
jgi:hypothetical protein